MVVLVLLVVLQRLAHSHLVEEELHHLVRQVLERQEK
jgi:hypothetical protein